VLPERKHACGNAGKVKQLGLRKNVRQMREDQQTFGVKIETTKIAITVI